MMKLFRFIGLVFFISCSATNLDTSDNVVFEQKKTPCYGDCPVYELKIYDNRTVEIEANQNLDLKGHFMAKISKERFDQIKNAFDQSDFFQYEEEYTSNMTDLPSTIITYRKGEKAKTIIDYDKAPESLKNLEKKLHNLIDELNWKEVNN